MKLKLFLIAIILIFEGCQTQQINDSSDEKNHSIEATQTEQPIPVNPKTTTQVKNSKQNRLPKDSVWLENKYFKTLYSKNQNIAYFSEYTLTKKDLCTREGLRRNNFHGDLKLSTLGLPMPLKSWYQAPYDRGHLAPAGDFLRSQDAVDATFLMSNMTPQKDKFNRYAWEALEEETRGWGIAEEKIIVITGPILEKNMPSLPGHPVPIPRRHFKAILALSHPKKMIGFIMPQTDSKKSDFKKRVVSISEIEKEIGIDIFNESEELESHADLSKWKRQKCSGE